MMKMKKFFTPKSIAVIGASHTAGKVGYEILKNLKEFSGKIFPVNPNSKKILGFPVFPEIEKLPPTELAIIAIPAKFVPQVLRQCGEKKIKNVIIISAGFREIGKEGAVLEKEICEIADKLKIKIIGPNCLGVLNPAAKLNASFASGMPTKGKVALVSQSGAMAVAILDWATQKKLGFSKIISLGNKSVIDETNVLEFLAEDQETELILFYLEDFVRGRKFVEVAQKITKKPIIMIKAGRTASGALAAASHTGALVSEENTVKTAMKQARVLRVDSIEEFFDTTEVFSFCSKMESKNLAIITNAGGPGIMATDAVAETNLAMAKFTKKTITKLQENLPKAANVHNPIDVIGDAKADRYEIAIENVMKDPNVGAVLVILTPQTMTEPQKTAGIIVEMKRKFPKKPLVTSFIGGQGVEKAISFLEKNEVAHFEFPSRAATALAQLYKFHNTSKLVEKKIKDYLPIKISKTKKSKVAEILKKTNLMPSDCHQILKTYGIEMPNESVAKTEKEALEISLQISFPVVMKIVSAEILHKTDVGGVRINVQNEKEVGQFFREIIKNTKKNCPQAKIDGILIQKMLPVGREVIIGVKRDANFGPMVAFGLGGIYVNIFNDVTFRIAPINFAMAEKMIEEIKAIKLLRGVRGEKAVNLKALAKILVRISILVTDFPEISEIDFNPVIATEKKAIVADAKILRK
jgi:acetyltransferase